MLVFGIFCAQAVFGVTFESTRTSDYQNGWDGVLDYSAGRDKVLTGVESYHDNHREDRRWKFYTSEAEGLTCSPGSWTGYKNGWDGYMDWHCGGNQALNAVYSYHNNHREDRLYKFKCCDISSGGKFYIHSVHTTSYLNKYDDKVDAKCNPNSVLVGLKSMHYNHKEDRRWALICGIVQERADPIVIIPPSTLSGYLNNWDATFAWTAPSDLWIKNRHGKCLDFPPRTTYGGKVYMYSCNGNNKNQQFVYNKSTGQIKVKDGKCLDAPGTGKNSGDEVRIWHCDTNNPDQQWEYNPSTGLIKQQNGGLCVDAQQRNVNHGKVHMWPCNKNNANQQWDMGTGGVKALVGLNSHHDNGREDRRWRAYYASTPGVTCNPSGWTDYQNRWDSPLDFKCPHNQILAGFGGQHNNGKEDREYRFRCCSVESSGFHISNIRTDGEANSYDGDVNVQCARNEVLVGAYSRHHNDHEDRKWFPYCGTLTQNPPDYDDCSEVEIIDVIVGDIEAGTRTTESVGQYSQTFKACGNSLTSGMSTLNIEGSKSVSSKESLTLAKSLEQSFKFSSTLETTFKMSSSVKAEVKNGVSTGSATNSLEFGLRAAFTAETGSKMSSTETSMTENGTIKVNVVTSSNTFEPVPYQWREARATYLQQDVTVPLRMKAQCRRKDGRTKTLWIESTLKAAAYSQIDVEFIDRTAECPQSYYKKCECVTNLKSEFITKDDCQTHPFMNGHEGCYVYKGNNCGNGQGLGASEPIATKDVCMEPARCPDAKLYIDWPLDPYTFEWSYKPCGGDQYYPGDPDYTGPEVKDIVEKVANKHCHDEGHGTLGDMSYKSHVQAILACDQINRSEPGKCFGVYDPNCDNVGVYYLCSNAALENSGSSCVWKMQDHHFNVDGQHGPVDGQHVTVDDTLLKGGVMYSTSDDLGEDLFNKRYQESQSGVILRECPSCPDTHKVIYYKRLTNVETFKPYTCMVDTWATTCDGFSNVLNKDFELYGSLKDLQNGENKWTFCNYNDAGVGFPRDCGPTGSAHRTWNAPVGSRHRASGKAVTYYAMEKPRGRRRAENELPKAAAGEPADNTRTRYERFVEFGADMLKTNL